MKKKIGGKKNALGVFFVIFAMMCTTLFGVDNDNLVLSNALSTLTYSDNNAELVLNEVDQKMMDESMTGLSEMMRIEGYSDIVKTSSTMIYVSKELERDMQYHVVSDVNTKFDFHKIYNGGGSYYIWQLYQSTYNDSVTGTDSTIYFWATSNEKIELAVYPQDSSEITKTTAEEVDSTEKPDLEALAESKNTAARAKFYQLYYIAEGGNDPVVAPDTSKNWTEIVAALNKDYAARKAEPNYKPTYQIQLNSDLLMPVNWSASLTGANLTPAVQWSLAFTSELTGGGKATVTLPNQSVFGAHVRMHGDVPDASLLDPDGTHGVNLITPTRVPYPTQWEYAARNNFIQANGWSFVVERNVEVTGCATVYGTLHAIPNGDFRAQKKYVNADGNTSTNIELYSGTWYAVGGVGGYMQGHNYYESNVIIGSPEDTPDNHVTIEYAASPVAITLDTWGYIRSSRTKNSTLPSWNLLTQGYTDVGVIISIWGYYAGAVNGAGGKPSVNIPWLKIDVSDHTKVSKSIIEDTYTAAGLADHRVNLSILGGSYHPVGGVDNATQNAMIWDITVRDDAVVKSGVMTASTDGWIYSVGPDSSLNLKILDRAIIGGGVYNGGGGDISYNGSHHLTIKGDPNDAKGVQIGSNVIGALGEQLRSNNDSIGGSPNLSKVVTVDIDHAQIYGSVMGITEGSQWYYANEYLTLPNSQITVKNSTVSGSVSAMALRMGDYGPQGNNSILKVNIDQSTVGSAYVFDRLGSQGNLVYVRAKEMTLNVTDSVITSQTYGMDNVVHAGGGYYNWFTRVTGANNQPFIPYYDMKTDTLKVGTPRNIIETNVSAAHLSVGILGQSGMNLLNCNNVFSWHGEGKSINTMTLNNIVFENPAVPVVNLGVSQNIAQYGSQEKTIVVNISNIKSNTNQKINILGLSGNVAPSATMIPTLTFNLKNLQNIEYIVTGINQAKPAGQVIYNMQDVDAKYMVPYADTFLKSFVNTTLNSSNLTNINLYDGNVIGDGNDAFGLSYINGNVASYPGSFDGGTTLGKDTIIKGQFLLNTAGYNPTISTGILKMEGGNLKLWNNGAPKDTGMRSVGMIQATGNSGGLYLYKNPGNHDETFPLRVSKSGVVSGDPLRVGEWSFDDSHAKMNEDILLSFDTEANAIADNYTSELVDPFTVVKSKINPKNIVLGPKSYKIVYEPMGAIGTPIVRTYSQVWNVATDTYDDPIIPAGEILTIMEANFIPPDNLPPDQVYDFLGWTRDDGGEILAADVETATFPLERDLVLSAHWSPRIVGVELKLKSITQESADNKSYQALEGAEFTLYKDDGTTLINTITGGADGIINFGKLEDGEYILVETQAPTGYRTPLGKWKITVDHSESSLQGQLKIVQDGTNQVPALINGHVQNDATIAYLIPVALNKPLPMTGYGGIKWFYIVGGGLMILVVGGYLGSKKKISKTKKQAR